MFLSNVLLKFIPCLQISNPSKMRVDVRFYADLISCGVLTPKEGLPLLGSFLTNLIHGDKEEHNSATIILAFCKFCGEDYAGLVSQKLLDDAERFKMTIPTSNWLPPDKRQNVRNLLREYYTSLCKHLTQVRFNSFFLFSKKSATHNFFEISGSQRASKL